MAKTLLIVAPEVLANLPTSTKRRIAAAGYVLVGGDPSQFKALDALTVTGHHAIARAALRTIKTVSGYGSDEVKKAFAKNLLDEVVQ